MQGTGQSLSLIFLIAERKSMGKRKWYEWLLTLTYFGMIALFLYLNIFSSHAEGLENIIINGVMFVIVGIIFLN